jgi:hypothetical protein
MTTAQDAPARKKVTPAAAARILADQDPVIARLLAETGPPRFGRPTESHFATLVLLAGRGTVRPGRRQRPDRLSRQAAHGVPANAGRAGGWSTSCLIHRIRSRADSGWSPNSWAIAPAQPRTPSRPTVRRTASVTASLSGTSDRCSPEANSAAHRTSFTSHLVMITLLPSGSTMLGTGG